MGVLRMYQGRRGSPARRWPGGVLLLTAVLLLSSGCAQNETANVAEAPTVQPKVPTQMTSAGDRATFRQSVLEAPYPVMAYFYKDHCGACRRIAPTITRLSRDYAGKVPFVKVDAVKAIPLLRDYGIIGTPTLVMFKNGKEVNRMVGAGPEPEIRAALDALLK